MENAKVGRPTKYREEYCDMLIKHMSEGLSFESFAGVVKVNRDTLYEWRNKHPQFSDAHGHGLAANLLWWEKVGIEGMFMGGKDNPFNASVYKLNMVNRHKWRDKVETEIKADKPISIKFTDAVKEE